MEDSQKQQLHVHVAVIEELAQAVADGNKNLPERVAATADHLLQETIKGSLRPDRENHKALHATVERNGKKEPLRELRQGRGIRVLYVEGDEGPILLAAGDKKGDWTGWYEKNIPLAQERITEHDEYRKKAKSETTQKTNSERVLARPETPSNNIGEAHTTSRKGRKRHRPGPPREPVRVGEAPSIATDSLRGYLHPGSDPDMDDSSAMVGLSSKEKKKLKREAKKTKSTGKQGEGVSATAHPSTPSSYAGSTPATPKKRR